MLLYVSVMPEFDLTKKMAPFLDIHMLFDILDWISDVEMYPRNEILEVIPMQLYSESVFVTISFASSFSPFTPTLNPISTDPNELSQQDFNDHVRVRDPQQAERDR